MEEQKKQDNGMKWGTWMILMGVAIFFDILEFVVNLIPVAGQILSILIDMFAFATFWLVFKINGQKYSKKTMVSGFVFGFIPVLNALPECSATIIKLYFDARAKKVLAKVPGGSKVTSIAEKQNKDFNDTESDLKKAA